MRRMHVDRLGTHNGAAAKHMFYQYARAGACGHVGLSMEWNSELWSGRLSSALISLVHVTDGPTPYLQPSPYSLTKLIEGNKNFNNRCIFFDCAKFPKTVTSTKFSLCILVYVICTRTRDKNEWSFNMKLKFLNCNAN